MNLKQLFSAFFLFAIVTSSISIPNKSFAEGCEVTSAQFVGGTPVGPNWYHEGQKILNLSVKINSASECKDKKVTMQIIALSTKTTGQSIEATKTPLEVNFEEGAAQASSPFTVSEEKCIDLNQNSIKTGTVETLVATNYGLTYEGFITEAFDYLKSTSEYDGLEYGTVDHDPFYTKTELSKETTQKILDRIDDIAIPDSKIGLGTSLLYVLEGPIFGSLDHLTKTAVFQGQVAKNVFFELGMKDCRYLVKTSVDGGTTWKDGGELSYMCEISKVPGNDCDDGNWSQKSGFTPGIRPTVVTESLCLNKDGTGYDEECYEPLAPIPGFGRKINFADTNSEDGTQPFTLGTYVGTLIKIAVGAASVLAVIFLTVAGIQYMIAGKTGGGATLDKAKKKLFNVGWGLLVILGSWILLNTINPELLKINPKFEKVKLEVPEGDPNIQSSSTSSTRYSSGGSAGYAGKFGLPASPTVMCPGSGGPAAVKQIAESFVGKATYRFGGKGLPNKPNEPYSNHKNMCTNDAGQPQRCDEFCPAGTICIDCSAFVNHVLKCAGMKGIPTNYQGGSASAFPEKSYKITDMTESGGNIIIQHSGGSYTLKVGDLLGKGNNHVVMYLGGGVYTNATSQGDGRSKNKAVQMSNLMKAYKGKSHWLEYVRPYETL